MWGRRSRERRERVNQAAQEASIAARARAIMLEFEAFKRAEPGRSSAEIHSDILDFFKEVTPALSSARNAAAALIDIAPLGIQIASAAKNWHAASQAGMVLVAAVLAVRRNSDGIDDRLEREIGRFVGANLDQSLYAFTNTSKACTFGVLCDMLLEGGFAGRQFLQVANSEVRGVWDWATGLMANGAAGMSDVDLRGKLARGAWLSERQSVDLDPGTAAETMAAWVRETLEALATVPSLSFFADAEDEDAAWAVLCGAVDKADQLALAMQLPFAGAAGCATPLAARESGRDIVYLIAGSPGGAAVRYFGGDEYRKAPEVLQLPGAGLEFVRRVAAALEEVETLSADDLDGRSVRIDNVRESVGRKVIGPILARWPQIGRLTVIPVGEMQRIPVSTALVGGERLNTLVDVTLAPNAATVLLAARARPEATGNVASVMADPADGDLRIPWVVEEAFQVAAVYGQQPDLVVDYGKAVEVPGVRGRSALATIPVLNLSSEHVLTQVEDARVVHLACHGYLPDTEGLPGLLLHGRLTFDALEHHRFADGATVVLSACSVGRSISEAPFALLGFPAMLLSTGASEVVASTQPLLDCPQTVDLMVALHRYLRDGATAAQALALAIGDAECEAVTSAVWGTFEVYGVPPPRS